MRKTEVLLLGIDVGTSSAKVALFTPAGTCAATAKKAYPIQFPKPGWMEIDPDRVFSAVLECIRACLTEKTSGRVRAISISSQGEAIIPVDRQGHAVHKSIITFDKRSVEQCRRFGTRIGKEELLKRTGLPLHPMFSLSKILWLQAKEPDIARKTWKYMCYGDFIAFKLGADPAIDYSMASRTMVFNINTKKWDTRILDICDLGPDKFSTPIPSGTEIGTISPKMARKLDLPPDVTIVAGGHDQACNALGAGVTCPGVAMNSIGTTESIVSVDDHQNISRDLSGGNIPCNLYVLENMYSYMTFLTSSASVLDWFVNNFGTETTSPRPEELEEKLGQIKWEQHPRENAPFVFPFFAGSGTPEINPIARGAFIGLSLDTKPEEVLYAVLEGTAMEACFNIENMRANGLSIKEIRYTGGGTRSSEWLSLRSALHGIKSASIQVDEIGCWGAAILAGHGYGCYPDIAKSAADMIIRKQEFGPDKKQGNRYRTRYEEYKRVRTLIHKIWAT